MKKRVFIGIFISPKLKRKFLGFRNKYQDLPVRWIAEKNLHLTLIPPIELDDNEIVVMIEKLQTLKEKVGQIKIKFNRLSLGPNLRRPRLIWLGGEPNQKLIELKNKLIQILDLRAEGRPFQPHLTIARFKLGDYLNFPIKNLSEKINWLFTTESICVIESRCLPNGAEYTILETIQL